MFMVTTSFMRISNLEGMPHAKHSASNSEMGKN